jgi:hypothetical protein
MLGFKSFRSAAATLAGVELMHVIRKAANDGQIAPNEAGQRSRGVSLERPAVARLALTQNLPQMASKFELRVTAAAPPCR